MGYVSTLMRTQSAFEKAGILFLDNDAAGGIGVRFAAPKHWGSFKWRLRRQRGLKRHRGLKWQRGLRRAAWTETGSVD